MRRDSPFTLLINECFNIGYETEEEFIHNVKGLVINCIHPEDRDFVKREIQNQLTQNGESNIQYRMSKKDGNYIWVHNTGRKVITEDDREAIVSVCYDITEEIMTQQQVKTRMKQEQERLYAALFSLIPLVISVNLTRNQYQKLNYSNYHVSNDNDSGIFDDLITTGVLTIPLEERQIFKDTFSRDSLLKAYERGKKKVELEHRQIGDDGIVRWIQTQVIFVKSSEEGDLYEITLAQDISAKKQQEIQLKQALEEASKANHSKSDFLARMSHDIRTPLNAIIGLTALSMDEDGLTPQIKENLNNIRGSSDFLLGLVNDILDMAKIESGALKLKLEPYSNTDFIVKLKAMFEPQCKAKSIAIDFQESTQTISFMVDKLRMDQVFFNILSNAVKFTPEGGKITYYTSNMQIDEHTISSDFIIEDNGIGMSQKFLEHVFQSFEQEDNQYSANLKGSGLGLSIAKSLVELMGGTIRVESQKNKGTKVTVHLMFDRCNIDNAQKKISAQTVFEKATWNGKHILLVEDHPLNVEIATRLLEKVGFCVTQAANGQIAVNEFNASKEFFYSAILMDIRMPVMDGLEATKTIRTLKRPDAGSVPIIAMSANAYEEDVQKSVAVGMNEHLAKPINPPLLYQTLGKYL